MTKNLHWKILGIIAFTIIMGLIAYPFQQGDKLLNLITLPKVFTNTNFHLGLDLKGGTQLVYNVDLSKVPREKEDDILNGVEEVIRRRVDGLGVTEPVIQSSSVGAKKNIIVELPGIQDIQEAVSIVGKVVQLQFKEQKTELTDEEKEEIAQKNQVVKEHAVEMLNKIKADPSIALEETSKTSRDGYYTIVEEPVSVETLDNDIASILNEWQEIEENALYPELIETDSTYSIFKILSTTDTEEKEVAVSHILIAHEGAERASQDINRSEEEALALANDIRERINQGEDFISLSAEYSDDSIAKENEGILEQPLRETMSPYHPDFTDASLVLEESDISQPIKSPFGYHIIKAREVKTINNKNITYEKIEFRKEPEIASGWANTKLTGEHFDFASANFDPNTLAPLVNIQFNSKGKDLFAEITERNLNMPLAIFLDDKPIIGEDVYAPTVQSKITDGSAVITGLRSLEEASILAQNLNTGAIPAPINLIGESTIGATLGHDALIKGLEAGLIGLILLALYMLLYYRMSGLIAICALITYATILGGIIKVVGVTLTLAGLAGIILSIGMAVDANILIFERMKEEVQAGKSLRLALNEGFDRAWNSIRDSNISGLITCLVLFIFGTGIIRGFALTLGIGILISMLSAIIITKNYLKAFIASDKLSEKPYLFLPFTNKK
jgi:protein-export membrane protein SecD